MLKKIAIIFSALFATSVFAKDTLSNTIQDFYSTYWFDIDQCSEHTFEVSLILPSESPKNLLNPITCVLSGNLIEARFIPGYAIGEETGEYYPIDQLPKDKKPSYIIGLVAFFINGTQISNYISPQDYTAGSIRFRYYNDEQRKQSYIYISTIDTVWWTKTGFLTSYIKNHPKLKLKEYRYGEYFVYKDHPNPAIILEQGDDPLSNPLGTRGGTGYLYHLSIYENIVQPDGTVSP